jgi:hypothetical protein
MFFGKSSLPCRAKPEKSKIESVPIEIREFACRMLFELSHIIKSKDIIDGDHDSGRTKS